MNLQVNITPGKPSRSTAGRRRVARRQFLLIALVLAIGSAGQIPTVQAAPAGETGFLSMRVQNPRTKLRCGETVTYPVRVEFARPDAPTPMPGSFGSPKGLSVINVRVEASSTNKTVGDFVNATSNTALVFDDYLTGIAARFRFTAGTPGKTTLYFEGLVGNEYVSDQVEVVVLPCKFKVKTVMGFYPGIYDITVISDNAVMTSDEQGNFTGSATMYWVYSNFNLDPCTISISATDSQVDLTGRLDDDGGQFVATQTFQPQTDSGLITCPGGSGGGTFGFTVNPLTFSVASTGGVSTQTATAEGVSGLARIVVVPDEDTAAAFHMDSQAAVSSASWQVIPWDEIPGVYGVLPDLPVQLIRE